MAWCLWIPKTCKSKPVRIGHPTAVFIEKWFENVKVNDMRTLDLMDPMIYHNILGVIVEIGTPDNLEWMLNHCKATYEWDSYQRWLDAVDSEGYTPLGRAIVCGNLPCVSLLLAASSESTKDYQTIYPSYHTISPHRFLQEKLLSSGHWKITFNRRKHNRKIYTAPLWLAVIASRVKGAVRSELIQRVATPGAWCNLTKNHRSEMLIYASRRGYFGVLLRVAERDIAMQTPISGARTVKYKVTMDSLFSVPPKYGSVLHNLTWTEDHQAIVDYYGLSLRYGCDIGLVPDEKAKYGPLLSVLIPNDYFAGWMHRTPQRMDLFRLFVRMGATLTQNHVDRCLVEAARYHVPGIVPMLLAMGYHPSTDLVTRASLESLLAYEDSGWIGKPMPEEMIAEWRWIIYFEVPLLTRCLECL